MQLIFQEKWVDERLKFDDMGGEANSFDIGSVT